MATARDLRPDEVNRAIETKGRSEVEAVLGEIDAPRIIERTSAGRTGGTAAE
jgi:hypothetical protein